MASYEVLMNTLRVRPEVRLARPLKVLVPLINDELTQAREAGLEHYRAVGEMLQEAKSQVQRGQWGKWLGKNFNLSQTTAFEYMRLAGEMEIRQVLQDEEDTNHGRAHTSQPRDFKTLSEFTHPDRHPGHRPEWFPPVRQAVDRLNVARMREEAQDKEKEQKLQRQLGLQLIDIGYKVLATRLHPDKGGSREAMTRLNQVRDVLKGAL